MKKIYTLITAILLFSNNIYSMRYVDLSCNNGLKKETYLGIYVLPIVEKYLITIETADTGQEIDINEFNLVIDKTNHLRVEELEVLITILERRLRSIKYVKDTPTSAYLCEKSNDCNYTANSAKHCKECTRFHGVVKKYEDLIDILISRRRKKYWHVIYNAVTEKGIDANELKFVIERSDNLTVEEMDIIIKRIKKLLQEPIICGRPPYCACGKIWDCDGNCKESKDDIKLKTKQYQDLMIALKAKRQQLINLELYNNGAMSN